jgi:hypothetical protein
MYDLIIEFNKNQVRYHFETDSSYYLPTITFENGPIEVDIMWQNAMSTYTAPQCLQVLI